MNKKIEIAIASNFYIQNLIFDDFSNDDDEDDEDNILFLAENVSKRLKNNNSAQPVRITGYVENIIPSYNERQFQSHFRLTRRTFDYLLSKINNLIINDKYGRPTIEPNRQLLSVLWLLATPDSYRSVGDRFNMGKSSLAHCFVRIIEALNSIAHQIISWPANERIEQIKKDFKKVAKLDQVIGIVDGSYISIKAPQDDPEVYINRKCFYGMTLQAICDSKMNFLDCFTGYPSSVSDIRIFRKSDIYKEILNNIESFCPGGSYILGDKAYHPVTTWCIPPYIDRGRLTDKQIYFNNAHAKTRSVIERSFALLTGRFRRLKYLDMNRVDLIPATIIGCCVLHNICLQFPDDTIDDYILQGSVNEYVNDNEIEILENEPRGAGIRKRDEIADNLYRNRRNFE